MLYPEKMTRITVPPRSEWAQKYVEPPKATDKNLTGAAALRVYEELVAEEAGGSNLKPVWMAAHAKIQRKYPEIAAAAARYEDEMARP